MYLIRLILYIIKYWHKQATSKSRLRASLAYMASDKDHFLNRHRIRYSNVVLAGLILEIEREGFSVPDPTVVYHLQVKLMELRAYTDHYPDEYDLYAHYLVDSINPSYQLILDRGIFNHPSYTKPRFIYAKENRLSIRFAGQYFSILSTEIDTPYLFYIIDGELVVLHRNHKIPDDLVTPINLSDIIDKQK